jgi:hypothetical protein
MHLHNLLAAMAADGITATPACLRYAISTGRVDKANRDGLGNSIFSASHLEQFKTYCCSARKRGRKPLDATREPEPQAQPSRVHVIVITNGDSEVEIYALDNVTVHFVHRLDSQTIKGEQLADEYLDLCLPPDVRSLYIPENLRGTDVCCRLTAQDEARRREDMEILAELKRIQDERGEIDR